MRQIFLEPKCLLTRKGLGDDAGSPRCSPDVSDCCACCLWQSPSGSHRRGIAGLRQSGSRCRDGGFAARAVGGFQPLGQQWTVQLGERGTNRRREAATGHARPSTAPGTDSPWRSSPCSHSIRCWRVIGRNWEMISIFVLFVRLGVRSNCVCEPFFPCDGTVAGLSRWRG